MKKETNNKRKMVQQEVVTLNEERNLYTNKIEQAGDQLYDYLDNIDETEFSFTQFIEQCPVNI